MILPHRFRSHLIAASLALAFGAAGVHAAGQTASAPLGRALASTSASTQPAGGDPAAAAAPTSVTGVWEGTAQGGAGQPVPVRIEIKTKGDQVEGAFLNGDERSPSTSGSYRDGRLVLNFNYYLTTFDATVAGDVLTGNFGGHGRPTAITAHLVTPATVPVADLKAGPADIPRIAGDWEIAIPNRAKGEHAWKLQVRQNGAQASAVILRIDGDTGRLYGSLHDGVFALSKFTADGPATLTLAPQTDGTLQVLQRRGQALIARRPDQARIAGLPGPDDPLQHTTLRDPAQPLTFSFPDLNGHVVSSTDEQFKDKVVIVAIGGSWCPNCHDEAPFLVDLYRKYHSQGLEVVDLDFEDQSQLVNPMRLHAFIARYNIPYTVLLAGQTSELSAKLPQAVDLNCWPTTFYIGRDGLVKAIHAGFASPATKENADLQREVSTLLGHLLAEK